MREANADVYQNVKTVRQVKHNQLFEYDMTFQVGRGLENQGGERKGIKKQAKSKRGYNSCTICDSCLEAQLTSSSIRTDC